MKKWLVAILLGLVLMGSVMAAEKLSDANNGGFVETLPPFENIAKIVDSKAPSLEKRCVEGKCQATLYSYQKYARNSEGNWAEAKDLIQITNQNNDLTFTFKDKSITLEAGAMYSGEYVTLAELKRASGVTYEFPSQTEEYGKKYAISY